MSTTKRIHVNRQHIAMNLKDGGDRPIWTIKEGGKTTYCRSWHCTGEVRGVTGQLACGAKAWLETEEEVIMTDPMTFKEARNAG